jgi:hypothetical protein
MRAIYISKIGAGEKTTVVAAKREAQRLANEERQAVRLVVGDGTVYPVDPNATLFTAFPRELKKH